MDRQNSSGKRGRFNIIDFIIFALILAVLGALVYLLFFSSSNLIDKFGGNEKTVTVFYRFEVVPTDNSLLGDGKNFGMKTGDKFVDTAKDYEIGSVYAISEPVAHRYMSSIDYKYYDSSLKSVVVITVKAEAVKNSDGTYTVKNNKIRIGDTVSFGTPYFNSSAKCISIGEALKDE